jgi:hypothetical protein
MGKGTFESCGKRRTASRCCSPQASTCWPLGGLFNSHWLQAVFEPGSASFRCASRLASSRSLRLDAAAHSPCPRLRQDKTPWRIVRDSTKLGAKEWDLQAQSTL